MRLRSDHPSDSFTSEISPSMHFTLAGLLRLKPFDERSDGPAAGPAYASSLVLSILVVGSALGALCALFLVAVHHTPAFPVLGFAIGASAVAAGLEWNSGLHARAMNQLFAAVIAILGFVVLSHL